VAAPDFLFDGPTSSRVTVVLAHGAGAPMDTPFMNDVARGLASRGLRIARFEFPYMAARRRGGPRRAPNPPAVLEQSWIDAIDALGGGKRLVVGGKSMGGRIASMVADRARVLGLLCLGYPFHPPGRPAQLRTRHLATLATPALIVQGERDEFGTRDEVAAYALAPGIRFHWLADGDHSFKPRKSSGRTLSQNLDEAVESAAAFAGSLAPG
jgi:predicted alpha/beta-hydrolase family hydrolase